LSSKYKYLEKEISNRFYELEKMQSDVFHHEIQEANFNGTPPDWWYEEDDQLHSSYESILKSLHNQIICYLDMMNLNNYLEVFIEKFGKYPKIEDAYNGIEFDSYNNEIYNSYLHDLWSFLIPFNFFKNNLGNKRDGIKYLETILKNTAKIIYDMKKQPTSEAKVYNVVKVVLYSIFSSSKKAGSNFLKTAKEFKPDILIPEIGVAIEYKYADNENKLKTTLEQIAADVKGYTGDNDYYRFYAVFYVTQDFWGKDRFNQIWQEYEFPKNWKAYYIVGNKT